MQAYEVRIPVDRQLLGASHCFDEPGALEALARLATDWFAAHLESRVETTS